MIKQLSLYSIYALIPLTLSKFSSEKETIYIFRSHGMIKVTDFHLTKASKLYLIEQKIKSPFGNIRDTRYQS